MMIAAGAMLTDVFSGLKNHPGAENAAYFVIPNGSRVVVPISHMKASQLRRELGRCVPSRREAPFSINVELDADR
jgi:hypothetical protein